jgi:HAE1 family hydrophobic/amphiphilic exporter-1
MPNFFIRRPTVAIVIAILMVIVGAITIATLPVAQFPNIAPPEIFLQATYPGADAQTLEQAVATPIEQQVSGVDNMTYMYSLNATANQQTQLLVDFDLKTDPNTDLLLTQSRQQLANGQLPPEVNNYGITLKKSATAPLMLIALYSPHGTRDANYLANYAYINLNDPIARSYGVGQATVFGSGQYAMRLWVKPDQLAKLGITVTDIVSAIKAQNTVNPAGQVGGQPTQSNQQFTYAVLAQGRLTTPEQFGDVIVREAPNGGTVRVKDVARAELGTHDLSPEWQACSRPCRLPVARLQRCPNCRGRPEAHGADEATLPPGHRLRHFARPNTPGNRRHEGDHRDSLDCNFAGDSCGLSVLARLARHADSHAGGACLARRNLYHVPAVWFLDQHTFDVWIGAGSRISG